MTFPWKDFPALLILAAAACGGRSDRTPTDKPSSGLAAAGAALDPCTLLTGDDIRAATGWELASTSPSNYGSTAVCNYYGPRGIAADQMVAVILSGPIKTPASSAAMADWRRGQIGSDDPVKPEITPVEGLGVPAIYNEALSLVGLELVREGQLIGITSQSRQISRTLAQRFLATLNR